MSKIVIVGGGVAGLTAGIYAQLSGYESVILEKHSLLGGNLTGWQRGKYHIDNCLHWLTGTNPNDPLYTAWKDVGMLGGVDIYQPETLYTYSFGDKSLSLYANINKLKKEMFSLSLADEEEINAFISAVKTMQGISGIAGENHDVKYGFSEILRKAPQLIKYHRINIKELSDRFSNPIIKKFLLYFLGESFSALALISVFATFCGGNGKVPVGGSLAAAKRIADRYLSLGGKAITGVQAVRATDNSVLLSDGREIIGDKIILTIDPNAVFGKMLSAKMPLKLKRAYSDANMKRFSSIHSAFSCKTEDLPFRGDCVLDIPSKYRDTLKFPYMVLKEFSHEPSFAPTGETVVQAFVFVGLSYSRQIIELYQDKPAYKLFKRRFSAKIEELICEKFPSLFGKLTLIDSWTPATYKRYTGATAGEYMSFTIPQMYIPRKISGKIKGYKNVVMANRYMSPPGGLPNALQVGEGAIRTILKEDKSKWKTVYAGG